MSIPVRNVYYFLLYAWKLVRPGEHPEVKVEGIRNLHDLFAGVLADEVKHLVAPGLDRGYVPEEAAVAGVRGRMDVGATVKAALPATARTHCHFDELRHDVLHNRIIKATLRSLLSVELDTEVRGQVARMYRKLDTIADVRITANDFGRVQLHRSNHRYRLALNLCWLVHENLMVAPGTGQARFRDFRRSDQRMGKLFERFVYHFFDLEHQEFKVSNPVIGWHGQRGSASDLRRLPEMQTDVVLTSRDRCIILDTKYYANALSRRRGVDGVQSAHLYQILAYLTNLSAHHDHTPPHEGMLLYPVVGRSFSFDYSLNGWRIQVRSIDVGEDWAQLRSNLLGITA